MKKVRPIRFICLGGIISAISVILQAAPIYLPVFGMVISPVSTLPVAIATGINVYLGLMVFMSSALVLIIVSIQEAFIFIFTTGLLGLVLAGFIYRKGILISVFITAAILTGGMITLTYIIGIPGFEKFAASLSLPTTIMIYSIFSLFYIYIWAILLRRFTHRLLYAILKQ